MADSPLNKSLNWDQLVATYPELAGVKTFKDFEALKDRLKVPSYAWDFIEQKLKQASVVSGGTIPPPELPELPSLPHGGAFIVHDLIKPMPIAGEEEIEEEIPDDSDGYEGDEGNLVEDGGGEGEPPDGGSQGPAEDYRDDESPQEENQDEDSSGREPPQRSNKRQGNILDKANRIRNLAQKAKTIGKVVKAARAAPLLANPVTWIVLGIILLILILIIVIILIIMLSGGDKNNLPVPVTITKTGPPAVANGATIDYTFSVSFPGAAGRVEVKDKLPDNTEFVSASNGGTYDAGTNTVSWTIKQIILNGSAPFDTSGYAAPPYLLPIPNCTPTCTTDYPFTSENMVKLKELGNTVDAHKNYLVAKVPNHDPLAVEPFASVIWSGSVEGIKGDRFFYNCKDTSKDINAGCAGGYKSGFWQVGYGVQVHDVAGWLHDDFIEAYGSDDAAKVQQVGQAVIADSGGRITNPTTFPSETISNLVTKANAGDVASQQAIAILLMDKTVGAISVARAVGGNIASQNNWRATMEGWSSYYVDNMQKFANRMQSIAQQYTGASGSTALTLTLKPLKDDIYIVNQATAEGFGAETDANGQGPTPTTPANDEDLAPADENCGFYTAIMKTNPYNKNFGDPNCSLVKNNAIDNNIIAAKLQELDSANSAKWLAVIVCLNNGSNPNFYYSHNDGTSEIGLFSLSGDQGYVQWIKQIKNAIAHNTANGGDWSYWGCNIP